MGKKEYIRLDPEDLYIHQIRIRRSHANKPKKRALFLPGYAAPVGAYFSIFNSLQKAFDEVTYVDFLGMGCSGRPTFQAFDTNDCIDFFIMQLILWNFEDPSTNLRMFVKFSRFSQAFTIFRSIRPFFGAIFKYFLISEIFHGKSKSLDCFSVFVTFLPSHFSLYFPLRASRSLFGGTRLKHQCRSTVMSF